MISAYHFHRDRWLVLLLSQSPQEVWLSTLLSQQLVLQSEADLTFSKALAVTLSVEAAEKNTQQLNGCESLAQTVSYQSAYMRSQVKGRGNPCRKPPAVNSGNPQGKQQCYRSVTVVAVLSIRQTRVSSKTLYVIAAIS